MTVYLSSFYPISCTKKGKEAVKNFNFPPFIDGSCRREPDFENEFPAITGLCRPGFAEKLKNGDIVIYITNKKGIGSRKVVAILEIIYDSCSNHNQAANWYNCNKYTLPNNLMVNKTKPYELEKTHQLGSCESWVNFSEKIENWNNDYVERANNKPKVAICKSIFIELNAPKELTEKEMIRIFNRIPGTRNPSIVKENEWNELKKIIL